MRRLLALILCLIPAVAAAQTPQTKAQLQTEINTNYPDNTTGLITPSVLRSTSNDFVASWQQARRINPQVGTSYTFTTGDYGYRVMFSNANPITASLPQANTTGFSPWNATACNVGVGALTILPTVSTINYGGLANASLVMQTGQCVDITSDGVNYFASGLTVQSAVCGASNWVASISLSGATVCRQPAFSDLSGTIAAAQVSATTITGQTANNSPNASNDYVLYYNSTDNAVRKTTIGAIAAASTAGVSSLNGLTGGLSIVNGAMSGTGAGGIGVASSGTTVTLTHDVPFGFSNCSIAASIGSNLLTVALKDSAGNDPSATSACKITFRSAATSNTGSTVTQTVTAPLSINTFGVGATLGTVNSKAFRFWVVAFDNGGTVVLGLFNAVGGMSTAATTTANLSCTSLPEDLVASSTAISGSATSAGVIYTPNGTTISSKSYRVLGYVEYSTAGLATAGTYNVAPTFVSTFSPGNKKPCDPVKSSFIATNATGTNSTNAFVAQVSSTLTLNSAADLVDIQVQGLANIAANGITQTVQVHRGSSACTTALSPLSAVIMTGPTQNQTTVSIGLTDWNGATQTAAYSICNKNSDNTTAVTFPNTSGSIRLTEIMG